MYTLLQPDVTDLYTLLQLDLSDLYTLLQPVVTDLYTLLQLDMTNLYTLLQPDVTDLYTLPLDIRLYSNALSGLKTLFKHWFVYKHRNTHKNHCFSVMFANER